MNKRRLLALAKFLETKVPRKRFNYSDWVGTNWKGKQDLSCGTTGCALGWAATMPLFRRLGMELRKKDGGGGYVALKGAKEYGSEASHDAAIAVFSISTDESEYLFAPFCSGLPTTATPKRVARHIRQFVERGGMP